MMQWEGHSITSVIFHDAQNPQSSSNLRCMTWMHHLFERKQQANLNWETVSKVTVLSKVSRSWESKTKECSRLKETLDRTTLNRRSWTKPFCYKGHYLDTWWNLMRSDYSMVKMYPCFNFPDWDSIGEHPFLKEIHMKVFRVKGALCQQLMSNGKRKTNVVCGLPSVF